MSVYRIYAAKKDKYDGFSGNTYEDIKENLGIKGLESVKIYNRYDVEDIEKEDFERAIPIIFSEPQTDMVCFDLPSGADRVLAVEYLPGQFDQRADSCEQCIGILTGKARPTVKSAKIYLFYGNISDGEFEKITEYLINPVESRKASLEEVSTLKINYEMPGKTEILVGFIDITSQNASEYINKYALAMDEDDLLFCVDYFKNTEKRDPTITELRMIDTYWSDHCRHTTFLTEIENAQIDADYIKDTYDEYLSARKEVYGDRKKPVTLMDIATLGAKKLKKEGKLSDLDVSDEINACSVKIKVPCDGNLEDYLLLFKNETHNHPTEIEPFGGAATCLGGAIRDPLSGRAYVYQAMRVTGASDPRLPVSETMKGKLPQRKISKGAAAGYSSYGNQIGLATGIVNEVYHYGYTAKRLEIGAVVGAAPMENVVRETPQDGDVVILIGGRTGRDGCGGATGSSKSHTIDSISLCGAEVQKGNPPEERKIQRLFRNKEVTRLIKRCNDFGAGGVSVAVGELADGLYIDLSAVPKKYEGLSGTELAISESQERMAVVVSASDVDKMMKLCLDENLEATVIAKVTEEPRLKMVWNGDIVVNISRDFLNSNGARKKTDVSVPKADVNAVFDGISKAEDAKEKVMDIISDLNVCSQKGLSEMFDSTIGASSVFMPFGGKHQMTPIQTMVSKIPMVNRETDFCSMMSYGFDPYLSEKSPYHGAIYAIVEAVTKLVATGCDINKIWLTLQEFFPRTKGDPKRWGLPFGALLGAYKAQIELGIGAIGGKDSMSGSFENIDVPPTLTAFAVSVSDAKKVVSGEFKNSGNGIYLVKCPYDNNNLPNFEKLKENYKNINDAIEKGYVKSSYAVTAGGICEAVVKMALGNMLGAEINTLEDLFNKMYGCVIVESDKELPFADKIGVVTDNGEIVFNGTKITLETAAEEWEKPLSKIYPTVRKQEGNAEVKLYDKRNTAAPAIKTVRPKVVIPVFPGTNCEYDTSKAFNDAGADSEIVVIRNLTPSLLAESVNEIERAIKKSNIVMLPGGFSGGDEPDGSGKFIASFFRNERIKEAVTELLEKRDGLMLGICNGFQALIKLGLVPYGKITDMDENCPTLTFNNISRHQSMLVNTKVVSTLSPWLSLSDVGDIHTIPISHGEGRFTISDKLLKQLSDNGQIATVYTDLNGNPTMNMPFNPNGSVCAIEGITSPDGRVFGKMGHSERKGRYVGKNVEGNKDQKIFESAVKYFK